MNVLQQTNLYVEEAEAFALNFDIEMDENLKKLVIAHKSRFKRNEIINQGLFSVIFAHFDLKGEFSPFSPVDGRKIISALSLCFNNQKILKYLIDDCHLFLKTDYNAYESIFNYPSLEGILKKSSYKRKIKNKRKSDQDIVNRFTNFTSSGLEPPAKRVKLDNSSRASQSSHLKSACRRKIENLTWKCDNIVRNVKDPAQEEIFIDPILYDSKQRTSWSVKHALSKRNASALMQSIININLKNNPCMMNEWYRISEEWTTLLGILDSFIVREHKLIINNGYVRVLRRHFKTLGATSLIKPVPKPTIKNYICDIIRKTIPIELFGGSKGNLKKFMSSAAQLIAAYKNQSFCLMEFVCHIPKNSKWILQIPPYFQRFMVVKVIKFFVEEYLLGILRNIFFVTESSSSVFELYFYLKADVESETAILINNLTKMNKLRKINKLCKKHDAEDLENLSCNETCTCLLPISKVRLLPKNEEFTKVRLITTKPIKPPSENIFVIKLFLECLLSPNGTGIKPIPSHYHLTNIWKKIAYLKERSGQKLYYVKADITDAFGSVLHEKLFKLLDKMMPKKSNPQMPLLKIKEWAIKNGKVVLLERKSFSRKLRNGRVLHSRSSGSMYSLFELKTDIIKIISNQFLLIGSCVYHVKIGLCQGGNGPLSPALCDFYYSAMDKECLRKFRTHDLSMLVRAVDDYLFVTVDKNMAEEFLNVILKGVIEYNAYFNTEKLETNLTTDCPKFSYLGLNFNINSLFVEPNYTKFKKGNLLRLIKLSNFASDIHFRRDKFMILKMKQFSGLKLIGIVLDLKYSNLQHLRTVCFEACLAQATKALELALLLRPGTLNLVVILYRVCSKLVRMVTSINPSISHKETEYMFWRVVLYLFEKYTGNFPSFNDIIKGYLHGYEKYFRNNFSLSIVDFTKNQISGIK